MNTNTNANSKDNEGSHLFLVRLWPKEKEVEGNPNPNPNSDLRANGEWGGRVQHVMSGEAHTFHDWGGLIEWLLTMTPTMHAFHQEETKDVL